MPDMPYPSGIKAPINSNMSPASSGFVRTDPYTQTISSGAVDTCAQDYMEPAETKQVSERCG